MTTALCIVELTSTENSLCLQRVLWILATFKFLPLIGFHGLRLWHVAIKNYFCNC